MSACDLTEEMSGVRDGTNSETVSQDVPALPPGKMSVVKHTYTLKGSAPILLHFENILVDSRPIRLAVKDMGDSQSSRQSSQRPDTGPIVFFW